MKFRKTVALLQIMLILASLFLMPIQTTANAADERSTRYVPLAVAPTAFGLMYLPSKKLDRDAIIRYAYKWSDKKKQYNNPAYRSFPNDCTNFVSQALRAGGWQDVGPSIPYYTRLKYEWWYWDHTPRSESGQSRSWTQADSFFQYINVSGRADFTLKLDRLEPGDVVQVDWEYDIFVDHTMIVTKKDKNDIYLTYHTGSDAGKPEKDMPLSKLKKNIKKDHPHAAFYGFRLRSSL